MNAKPNYQPAADLFETWRDDVLTGNAPILWQVGKGELSRIEIGPGRVTLLGGAPGAGKTALVMQWVIDGLRINDGLRALVCNVEMSPATLLNRQLARLSGIDLNTIQKRAFQSEHADRLDQALRTLEPVSERLTFMRPPFNLTNVAQSADAVKADLIVLDYVQRILPPEEPDDKNKAGKFSKQVADKRVSVNAMMDYIRQFADAGVAVLALAAVGRTKDNRGRTSYSGDGLNLASFRESSELEYGADDAFIVVPDEAQDSQRVHLRHLKARHSDPHDLDLLFDRRIQRFTPANVLPKWDLEPDKGKLTTALDSLWNQTNPADDDDGEPE